MSGYCQTRYLGIIGLCPFQIFYSFHTHQKKKREREREQEHTHNCDRSVSTSTTNLHLNKFLFLEINVINPLEIQKVNFSVLKKKSSHIVQMGRKNGKFISCVCIPLHIFSPVFSSIVKWTKKKKKQWYLTACIIMNLFSTMSSGYKL